MILGGRCTRNCLFCAIEHGSPDLPDEDEPQNLAKTIALLGLDYVVITSVTRDDLIDKGAAHFAKCIRQIRQDVPQVRIEILTPDFKGGQELALDILGTSLPDTMYHNIETVERLYPRVRSSADYAHSLKLLKDFKKRYPRVLTKSGLMAGLGETDDEILQVMRDLRESDVDILTIGQYLQPSSRHLPVLRFVHPDTFAFFRDKALEMGFIDASCNPLVRSSYMAEKFFVPK
jgi:lipoic acid synthetase